jgi:hypothetical protein
MDEQYHSHGVCFRYPEMWELSEEHNDDEVTITVTSPETSFWSLTIMPERPRPEDVIESAVKAFQDEYEEVDVYPSEVELCHRTSVARDLEFVCLELLNSAFLRAFRTRRFSTLVYYQGTDQELEETRTILESISASLECDEADFSNP